MLSFVLTFDLDFGETLALGVMDRPSVVIFRLSNEQPISVNNHLGAVIEKRSEELAAGALILIEDGRCWIRKFPIGRQ